MILSKSIRQPYVAGQFYEADPQKLSNDISNMLSELEPHESSNSVAAIILPHAGYTYSGKTALKTILTTTGKKYKKVILIAPSHRYPINGIVLSNHAYYRTPLGDISVDKAAVNEIKANKNPYISCDDEVHEYEHALEVELPLLQTLWDEFSIVPIICGHLENIAAEKIANDLVPLWSDDTLWVISSDFTHYGESFGYIPFTDNVQENIEKLDHEAIEHILNMNYESFSKFVDETSATICGSNPIKIFLSILKIMRGRDKAFKAKLIDYTNSGLQTGDFSHSVSYAGIAFSEV